MTKSLKEWMTRVTNTLIDVLGIGSVTVSGTTSAQGAINIESSIPTNAIPISAVLQGRTAFSSFYGRSWLRLVTWDGSAIANASVTITIYYVKKVGGGTA